MSYQKLILVGNLGRDPEMRYTSDGTPVTSFSIATNRKWSNSNGTKGEETVWFRITVWRRQAEIAAQYLSKGRQVMIEGRLTPDKETGGPRIWTGQDGQPRASFEVTAEKITFLSGRGDAASSSSSSSPSQAAEDSAAPDYVPEDDIPF